MGLASTATIDRLEDPKTAKVKSKLKVLTYYEWSKLLDAAKNGDDKSIELMATSTMDWTPGVAERFATALFDAFQNLLKKDLDEFGNVTKRSGDMNEIARGIRVLKNRLEKLETLSRLSFLPEEMQNQLLGHLDNIRKDFNERFKKETGKMSQGRDEVLLAFGKGLDHNIQPSSDAPEPIASKRKIIMEK